jgi:hypothetical protein
MECPRCGHQQADTAIECAACGVILAKARPIGVKPVERVEAVEAVEAGERDLPLTTRLVRLVLDDPRTDPIMLGVRIVLLLMLIVWTWRFARARVIENAAGMSFLHLINLPFHEAGHILFMPFGELMMVLGGSLFQVIVPASLTVVFLTKHRDVFGAAVTWWWTGENLVDLAPYIDDARTLQLVLIGGKTGAEVEGHDWERILMTFGWLHLDHTLGRLAHVFGVIVMLSALAWAVFLIVSHWQRARPEPLEPLEPI